MTEHVDIKWLTTVEPHDYAAALSYLSIIYQPKKAARFVKGLRKAEYAAFKAKDISRASGLSLLGISNEHVDRDRNKIQRGVSLSPILLVRDSKNGKVVIADGYHRMCAVYSFDEDAFIRCKIV